MSVITSLVMFLIIGMLHCTTGSKCANKFERKCIDPCLKATYSEIVDLVNHPEVLLIDARRPDELDCTGSIPTSINIPLSVVGKALKLSPKAFKSKYGRKKPHLNDPIIFYCRSGNRSAQAADIADRLGFTNVKNYVGSWLEYAKKNCLPLECPKN